MNARTEHPSAAFELHTEIGHTAMPREDSR